MTSKIPRHTGCAVPDCISCRFWVAWCLHNITKDSWSAIISIGDAALHQLCSTTCDSKHSAPHAHLQTCKTSRGSQLAIVSAHHLTFMDCVVGEGHSVTPRVSKCMQLQESMSKATVMKVTADWSTDFDLCTTKTPDCSADFPKWKTRSILLDGSSTCLHHEQL